MMASLNAEEGALCGGLSNFNSNKLSCTVLFTNYVKRFFSKIGVNKIRLYAVLPAIDWLQHH